MIALLSPPTYYFPDCSLHPTIVGVGTLLPAGAKLRQKQTLSLLKRFHSILHQECPSQIKYKMMTDRFLKEKCYFKKKNLSNVKDSLVSLFIFLAFQKIFLLLLLNQLKARHLVFLITIPHLRNQRLV